MPVLGDATALRVGAQTVTKAMHGGAQVWPVDTGLLGPGPATTMWATTGVYRGDQAENHVKMFESPHGINRPITGPVVSFCGRGQASWAARRTQFNTMMSHWSTRCVTNGGVQTLSLGLWPGGMGPLLAEAAAGDYTSHWEDDVTSISNAGYDADTLIIRPMWEFNGRFYPWSIRTGNSNSNYDNGSNYATNCANFIAAWRGYVTVIRDTFPNMRFDWCPLRDQDTAANVESAYPGDAYVDFIGLDAYNWGYGTTNENTRWDRHVAGGSAGTGPGLQWQRDFAIARQKLCSWPEWGITSNGTDTGIGGGGNDPTYIANMIDWGDQLGEDGLLGYQCYFEHDAGDGHHQLHNYTGHASYSGTQLADSYGDSTSTTAFDAALKA